MPNVVAFADASMIIFFMAAKKSFEGNAQSARVEVGQRPLRLYDAVGQFMTPLKPPVTPTETGHQPKTSSSGGVYALKLISESVSGS